MRVRFLQKWRDYPAGDEASIDQGVGASLLAQGIIEHVPLTEEQIAAIASAPQPGDGKLDPRDIAKRVQEHTIILRSIN